MALNRRSFLGSAFAASVLPSLGSVASASDDLEDAYRRIDAAASLPVLKKELFPEPVIIESVDLLRYEGNYLCRVRSTDGAVGHCVGHNIRMPYLYPIQLLQVRPFFPGKDARELDRLIDGVYVFKNNYKLQGMALWIPVATVEMAILDMLGNTAGKPMGELIGERRLDKIAIYQANNNRGRSAEDSIRRIAERVRQTGAKAVKFKIGGRMANKEIPADRSERLIPLMRETFGPDMVIYADANGSYDAEQAIRIGRVLEEHNIDLFEGPLPFDWYQDIKKVADALTIPVAGGEGEASLRNYRWLAANNVFQIYQHDLFYFGGMIRSMRVARMAHAMGHQCMPHISGTGLGYAYMLQFVSALPNPADYHEFKGLSRGIPFHCDSSSLKTEDGLITVPTGPGDGLDIDPDFIGKHKPV